MLGFGTITYVIPRDFDVVSGKAEHGIPAHRTEAVP